MTDPNLNDIPNLLAPFGLSETEALAYASLLKEGPATGYGVGRRIGKPTANAYKALASLAAKGAVAQEGSGRLCRAVPPEELLERLERSFAARKAEAVARLGRLQACEEDDHIYRLEDPEQVLARARAMLGRARRIALLDIFPAPFSALEEDLKAALGRGVRVAAQLYAPAQLPGADLVLNAPGAELLDSWPGQQLSLVVDASEHLLALLSHDGHRVQQAVWSASTFLSCMHHNHLACELRLTAQQAAAPKGPDPLAHLSLLRANPPGLGALKERFRGQG